MEFLSSINSLVWVVLLSLIGGLSTFLQTIIDKGLPRRKIILFFTLAHDVLSSTLSGLIAFWGCLSLEMDFYGTAATVSVAGHMGARWLSLTEKIVSDKLRRVFDIPEPKIRGEALTPLPAEIEPNPPNSRRNSDATDQRDGL